MPIAIPGTSAPQIGGGRPPFQVSMDRGGNLWVESGPVIAVHATTEIFTLAGTAGRLTAATRPRDEYRIAGGTGSSFQGGSGSNVKATTALPGGLAPDGFFQPSGPDTWSAGELVLTFDPGDGSASLSDGTDVVATVSAGPATVAPYGTLTATTYGEDEYNGGAPWSVVLEFEGGTPYPPIRVFVGSAGGEIQGGLYERTGWQDWESPADSDWTISINGADEFELSDGTDIVANRPADADRLYDPSGAWASTAYGEATYGEPAEVVSGTRSAGTFPEQAWVLADVNGTVETYVGAADPTIWIELDTADGDADIYDASGLVATRTSGVSTADCLGPYAATTHGRDTYHAGAAWTYTLAAAAVPEDFTVEVRLDRAVPAEGYLWVELEINPATGEVLGVSGPFRGASLPPNDTDLSVVPLAHTDGTGVVTQIQLGPIYWRLPEPGPAGTGLAWVSLTTAAYAALGTPDADTIYDITDYP